MMVSILLMLIFLFVGSVYKIKGCNYTVVKTCNQKIQLDKEFNSFLEVACPSPEIGIDVLSIYLK
jgi:hypothetical protein